MWCHNTGSIVWCDANMTCCTLFGSMYGDFYSPGIPLVLSFIVDHFHNFKRFTWNSQTTSTGPGLDDTASKDRGPRASRCIKAFFSPLLFFFLLTVSIDLPIQKYTVIWTVCWFHLDFISSLGPTGVYITTIRSVKPFFFLQRKPDSLCWALLYEKWFIVYYVASFTAMQTFSCNIKCFVGKIYVWISNLLLLFFKLTR